MTGVTRAQLEALAARAPSRAASVSALNHPARRNSGAADASDPIARARAYIATIPGAVAGERGHDRTFYAANRLVRGFGLDPDAAYPLLAEWNANCNPPWSEHELRRKLEQAARQPGPRGFLLTADPPPPGAHAHRQRTGTAGPGPCFCNYGFEDVPDGSTMRRIRRGRGGRELVDELVTYTGGWPRRSGKMLFVRGRNADEVLWIKQASELFAWIDWQFRFDDGRGFDWQGGAGCLTQAEFLEACRIHCENWQQVELFPHEPPVPGHYYHHPEVPANGDGSALSELVSRFAPATPEDDDLIRLMFLSMVWGGPPGKRPVFVIESAAGSKEGGRGAGKSTLASFAAALVGGYLQISPTEQIKDIHARLLSPEGLTRRVGLIDNLKSLRFSNSDLEGLVTSEVISGRQMYTGEGRRPNTLQWIITSNMPALSKDLAQRSVIVRVTTPVYDPKWQESVTAHIREHRWQIIADCVAELRAPGKLPDDYRFTRWSEWENQVLAKAPNPVALAGEVFGRQGQLDDDREIAAEVADAIRSLLDTKRFDPDKDCVLIPSQELFEHVVKKFGSMSRASGLRWLYTLGISSLSKWDANTPYRGAKWLPVGMDPETKPKTWSLQFSGE